MALPDSENLAYRGITSGNSRCMAYRGYVCGIIVQSWFEIKRFTLYINRTLKTILER